MANMPGFPEACGLAQGGMEGRIGVHLNPTEGRPITDGIRRCRRFSGAEGELVHGSRTIWRLVPDEARMVEMELAAQIEAVLAAGIVPTHLDSHHHIHTHWPIATVVIRLADRYRIRAIRLSCNCNPGLWPPKRLYKIPLNRRLAGAGLAPTDLLARPKMRGTSRGLCAL